MKKINKTLLKHFSLLALILITIILILTKGQFIYGSETDFFRQHVVFPEYFRNLFWETKNILPEFALHLGSGQNIFYFAYYGFFSPIILFSYLLPFIDMTTFLIICNILIVFISSLLLYNFLHQNGFNYQECFIGSLLLLLANSFIFHSHRHIMFINYFPFLLLALIGVIKYFQSHKSFLLIISINFLILTSFYFSIPAIISICLYGLYYYLKITPQIKFQNIFKNALSFLLRVFLGIGLASFILFPTIYIILNGRSSSTLELNLKNFFPLVNLDFIMYGTYGLGLTSIGWLGIIFNLIFGKKENKTIVSILLIIILIPFLNLLLNGGLYANGKILIPFLPLIILLVLNMINHLKVLKINWIIFSLGIFISLFFFKAKITYLIFVIIDIVFTLISLYLYSKKKKYIYFLPLIIIAFLICLTTNQNDKLVSTKTYENVKEAKKIDYENNLNDSSIYRFMDNLNSTNMLNYANAKNDYRLTSYSSTTNPYYTEAFYNVFNNNDIYRNKFMLNETNNLFFQRFMGVKYLLAKENIPYGYTKLTNNLYKSDNILPIGFSSSHILNEQEYNKLPFNHQLEAFNNNIIINGQSINPNLNTLSQKVDIDYKTIHSQNLTYEKNNQHYKIISEENGKINLYLTESLINDSLIIRFKMNNIPSCKDGDVTITINNIINKLTCKTWKYYNDNEIFDYVISSNEPINTLTIKFTKGIYDISNIEVYKIPNSFFEVNNNISVLKINNTYKNNNILSGSIDVLNDGYFIFTIPYDKGFSIYVDGKKQEYELVNKAFIGFKINKGKHDIELKFSAPLFNIGKIITIISILLSCLLIILNNKKVLK